ncbi:DF family (seleno)protein [Tautonia sociabilis]|uniref:Mercuric transport protein MerT n=1 Tax=Tautonia sociabilis TaxID=2080755 RepID=A0A432MFB7_9BACT|nr:mercuric transporter MerT family protein [Tautonia sociabilis]RUL84391.1 hypothetical protein TsocGM_20475 [Tautonia sociabilis]
MKVEVLYFEGCPNHAPALQLAREVVSELGLDATVEEVEVKTPEDVVERRFLGSPTVLVDGVDIEPRARERTDFAFACRTYDGRGVPPRELIAGALQGGGPGKAGCCSSPDASPDTGGARVEGRGMRFAAVGSVLSAVVASACCWLPFALLAFGASAAGVSASFEKARPVFLVAAFGLLGLGFYLSYFRREACAPGSSCAVPNPKLRRLNRGMLWVATAFVLAFALFPSYAGYLLAQNAPPAAVDGSAQSPAVTLGIKGMSCEACSVHIQKGLSEVPGVRSASVDYEKAQARVSVDPASAPSRDALVKAVERAGYEVTEVTETR